MLGVPCIAVLALIGEAAGIGGSQVLVGAGMGLGVGLMQTRALKDLLPRPRAWLLPSVLGLALPFGVFDALKLMGRELPFSLFLSVAVGGVIVGVWQAALLRPKTGPAPAWIAASALGWSLAALAAQASDWLTRTRRIPGLTGALIYLATVAVGGLVLGLVTGPVIVRLRSKVTAS